MLSSVTISSSDKSITGGSSTATCEASLTLLNSCPSSGMLSSVTISLNLFLGHIFLEIAAHNFWPANSILGVCPRSTISYYIFVKVTESSWLFWLGVVTTLFLATGVTTAGACWFFLLFSLSGWQAEFLALLWAFTPFSPLNFLPQIGQVPGSTLQLLSCLGDDLLGRGDLQSSLQVLMWWCSSSNCSVPQGPNWDT